MRTVCRKMYQPVIAVQLKPIVVKFLKNIFLCDERSIQLKPNA